jgi:hypothetical protein
MAKEPKGLKTFGAGQSDYIKIMQEISRKSGKTAKVPNPNNDKLTDVKPKSSGKSVMPKVIVKKAVAKKVGKK